MGKNIICAAFRPLLRLAGLKDQEYIDVLYLMSGGLIFVDYDGFVGLACFVFEACLSISFVVEQITHVQRHVALSGRAYNQAIRLLGSGSESCQQKRELF